MFVYLIQNTETKEIYIGTTNDLATRLREHNNKGKKFTTRKNGEWKLIYAEVYRSKKDALAREKRLKYHGSAKVELLKRLQNSKIV